MEHCLNCAAGELQGNQRCMRDQEGTFGFCPVADLGPQLHPENDLSDEIFKDLLRTSRTVETKDKVLSFVEIRDFVALCGVKDVWPDDQSLLWDKVKVLEEVWNDTRPKKPKSPGKKPMRRR